MESRTQSGPLRYAVAMLFTAAAFALRLALDPWLGSSLQLEFFYAAVALTMWYAGHRAALLTAVLGYSLSDYFFIPPRSSLALWEMPAAAALLTYAAVCGLIIFAGVLARRQREHTDAQTQALRRSEAQLRASEERLRFSQEAGRIGSWDWDLRANAAHCSPSFLALYALPSGSPPPTLEEWASRVHPEDRARTLAGIERAVREGTPFEAEFRIVLPDGEERWVAVRGGTVERNAAGQPTRLIAAHVDVTALKRTQQTLEAARGRIARERERLLSYLDQLPLPIAFASAPALRIEFVNEAVRRLWPGEIVGRTVAEASAAPERVLPLFEQVLRSGEPVIIPEIDREFTRPDGRTVRRSLTAHLRPWHDEHGRVSGVLCIAVDITDQVTLRRRHELEQERLRSYLEQLPLPVSLIGPGPDYRILSANAVVRRLLGRDVRGLTLAETSAHAAQIVPILDRVLATGEPVTLRAFESATPVAGSDFPKHYWDAIYQPWRAPDERIEGILTVALDVTAEVTARSEREALLTRERAARLEAERVNRAKDEFLAMLGHELRNPLSPIRNAAQILKVSGGNPARIDQASAIIVRQVEHLARLVDDLLDVSRVTRGLIELEREPLEMKNIVAGAIEQSRPLIEARHHALDVRLPSEPARVSGDRVRLVQVLVNLLNNAAKYTPEGGRIELALELAPEQLLVHVRDNGVGIGPDLLPHIFDLFTQGERSADRSQGGLGLGLALVKSLVQMHGGTVEVASDGAGTGTRVTVRLPRLAGAADARRPAMPGAPAREPRSGLSVLVVDDNVDAAESIAVLLELEGHCVAVEHTGRAALTRARAERPQALLLDIGLPDIDGYELARRLRSAPETAGALLIALTGYGQREDRNRSSEAGFDHHLVKPVDPEELSVLLARFAAERRAAHTSA